LYGQHVTGEGGTATSPDVSRMSRAFKIAQVQERGKKEKAREVVLIDQRAWEENSAKWFGFRRKKKMRR